jgi:hypothetical protein
MTDEKAGFGLMKKYPAVAGYLIKWTINGPKRGAKKRELFWLSKLWLAW